MIINNSGGGAALNFKVVGGTTAPAGPAENTIWVNTSTGITGWVFSADAPASPGAGTVWFSTEKSSGVAFNAVKKNGLWIYPSGCRQYVGGAWAGRTAKIYQGGAWVDWWTGELYSPGNTWDGVTGGWLATTQRYAATVEGSAIAATAPALTPGSDSLTAALSANLASGTLRTSNMIDLTDYSTITLKGTLSSSHPYCRLYIATDPGVNYGTLAAYAQLANTTALDISGVSGSYYVAIGLYGARSYAMTSCALS